MKLKSLQISFCIFLLSFTLVTPRSDDENEGYKICGNLFSCGKITAIDYPFWGNNRPRECGYPGLKLECQNETAIIEIESLKYRVLEISPDAQILRISRLDISSNICGAKFVNTTFNSNLFEFASAYANLTFLYGCPGPSLPSPFQFDCPVKGNGYIAVGTVIPGFMCHAGFVVPISYRSFGDIKGLPNLLDFVREGFEVRGKVDVHACRECKNSGGRCGYDLGSNKFSCLCSDGHSETAVCSGSLSMAGNTAQPSPAAKALADSSRSGTFVS